MNPFDRDVIGYKYGRNEGRGGGGGDLFSGEQRRNGLACCWRNPLATLVSMHGIYLHFSSFFPMNSYGHAGKWSYKRIKFYEKKKRKGKEKKKLGDGPPGTKKNCFILPAQTPACSAYDYSE